METKFSLVPTRTLFPQPKSDKKIKENKSSYSLNKGYQKVYNEKQRRPPIQEKNPSSPQLEANKMEYHFQCEFPKADDYSNMEKVFEKFPHLKDINKPNLHLDNTRDLKCFIMRSNNEDDIHKAIKYGIWTSTIRSNEFLNEIFNECQVKGVPIYFFFSVVRSGQFSAVAQMSGGIQEKHFQFWWEGNKWLNHFGLKWVFIKDVPYKCFDQFRMDDGTSVIRARDCTSIPAETAKRMLKIFQDYRINTSIFDAFNYMDIREDMLRSYRYSLQNYQNRMATKGPSKRSNAQNNLSSSSTSQDYIDPSLKEFELMLGFYQREQEKLSQDIEEAEKSLDLNEYIQFKGSVNWLSDSEGLKRREKELEEGLEDLKLKYSVISKRNEEGQDSPNQSQIEKENLKFQELEKGFKSLQDKFMNMKEKLQVFNEKIIQLDMIYSPVRFDL